MKSAANMGLVAIRYIEDYEKENKRLKMENELLRDFLRFTGRK